MLSPLRFLRLPSFLPFVLACAVTSASAQYHLGTRYGNGSGPGGTGSGDHNGSNGDTGSTGAVGSTGSTGGGDTGSGGGGGGEQTYGPGDTDLGGGTVTLARAIFNGGTVSNGTISASNQEAYAGEVTAVLTGGFLDKTTTGTFTISSASTYDGGIAIRAGTLKLGANGIANTSSISLASGATFDVSAVAGGFSLSAGQSLSGSGNLVGGVTVASGAKLASGTGSLTFADGLTLQSGAALDFSFGSTSGSIVVTGGRLTGPDSGALTLNLYDLDGFAAGTYTLFDFTDATSLGFDLADFTLGDAPDGFDYYIDFSGSTLQLTAYAVTAVPEPATAALGLGVAGLVAVIVRRRRSRRT